jgi:8-oxo-dGTP pyrophosphatase MutT (NUDIX family)
LRVLKKMIHSNLPHLEGNVFERRAARGIILRGSDILMLYTKRYNDYSFPGGGVDDHEDLLTGLYRELAEETGARNIKLLGEFGMIDEYRLHYKPEYDLIHMVSYYYICSIDESLDQANLEDYEIANGMSAVWVNIHDAIKHNEAVIAIK